MKKVYEQLLYYMKNSKCWTLVLLLTACSPVSTAWQQHCPIGICKYSENNRINEWKTWRSEESKKAASIILERVKALPKYYISAMLHADGKQLLLNVGSLISCLFLNNHHLPDKVLTEVVQLGYSHPRSLLSKHANQRWVHLHYNTQDLPEHRIAVGVISALTGVDPMLLSQATPELGLYGTSAIFFRIKDTWPRETYPQELKPSVLLHDVTDLLRNAGVSDMNQSLFTYESSFWSALVASGKHANILTTLQSLEYCSIQSP